MTELLRMLLCGEVQEIGGEKIDLAFEVDLLEGDDVLHCPSDAQARPLRITREHQNIVEPEMSLGILENSFRRNRPDLVKIGLIDAVTTWKSRIRTPSTDPSMRPLKPVTPMS